MTLGRKKIVSSFSQNFEISVKIPKEIIFEARYNFCPESYISKISSSKRNGSMDGRNIAGPDQFAIAVTHSDKSLDEVLLVSSAPAKQFIVWDLGA